MAKKRHLSQGFTLIELLVVVVVIATLMGLVFRLAGVGGNQKNRNITITRMQKLEFALSGYYAAFGSYPPVSLHGSRDIFSDVNDHGIQMGNAGTSQTRLEWPRVRAACLSQPVACEFPYNAHSPKTVAAIERMSKAFQRSYTSSGDVRGQAFNALNNASQVSQNARSSSWQDVQLFKFGVMSFLMPRYLFMLAGPKELYDDPRYYAQWRSQNDLSQLFGFRDGRRLYSDDDGWKKVQEDTNQNNSNADDFSRRDNQDFKEIMMQPSQAVCGRWMQALDGIVSGGQFFFGVDTRLEHDDEHGYHYRGRSLSDGGKCSAIYAPGDASSNSSGNQYMLNGMTVRDAWGMDLFYYSPPPYQSYHLWSAGPNGKTIPPWIDLQTLQSAGAENGSSDRNGMETAARWMSDDIVGLSTPAD